MPRMPKGGLKPVEQTQKKKRQRRLKITRKKGARSFRLQRAEKPIFEPLMSTKQLTKETFGLFKRNWKLFLGLSLLYAFFYRLFIEGITRIDFNALREALAGQESIRDKVLETGILSSAAFDATGTDTTGQDGFYAGFLTIVFGLCVVWATRQLMAGREVRIRDALYNGPAALIPVIILMVIIFLQAIPLSMGLYVYNTATSAGLVQGGVENMVLFIVTALSALLTCYWLSTSLIALPLATLPGMYPWVAMQEAKEMVTYRRWHIFLRIAIFAVLLAMIWLVVIVLTVTNPLTLSLAAEIVDVLRGLTLVVSIVFLYKLYRSLVASAANNE